MWRASGMQGRRVAGQTNKRWAWYQNLGGLHPHRRREGKSRNIKKKKERRAPPASQSAAQRNDKFFVRPRLSVTLRPYRSSRRRNRDRPRAVAGHALKAILASRCRHSISLVPGCERHAGQLLRPVSSHRSTQSLWNTYRHVNNVRSSSGS
jgi:hypothetical protein